MTSPQEPVKIFSGLLPRMPASVREYVSEAPLHGMAEFGRTRPSYLKLIWALFMTVAAIKCGIQVQKLVAKYAMYPMSVEMEATSMQCFPAVSICPNYFLSDALVTEHNMSDKLRSYMMNLLVSRALSEQTLLRFLVAPANASLNKNASISATVQAMDSIGKDEYIRLTAKFAEDDLQQEWERYRNGSTLTQIMKSLSLPPKRFMLYTPTDMVVTSSLTSNGLCYVVTKLTKLQNTTTLNTGISRMFVINVLNTSVPKPVKKYGRIVYYLFLQIGEPVESTEQFKLTYGADYQVYLHAARHDGYNCQPPRSCEQGLEGGQSFCKLKCWLQSALRAGIPCFPFLHERLDNPKGNMTYCTLQEFVRFNGNHPHLAKGCAKNCTENCVRWTFNPCIANTVRSYGTQVEKFWNEFISMGITMTFGNYDSILVSRQIPSFTVDDVVSNIGGLLSLFLGGSLVFFGHLVYFCLRKLVITVAHCLVPVNHVTPTEPAVKQPSLEIQ